MARRSEREILPSQIIIGAGHQRDRISDYRLCLCVCVCVCDGLDYFSMWHFQGVCFVFLFLFWLAPRAPHSFVSLSAAAAAAAAICPDDSDAER